MLQAVFYMFVFRHKQLLDLEDGKVMPAMHCFYEYSTVLQNVVIFLGCDFCDPQIVLEHFYDVFFKNRTKSYTQRNKHNKTMHLSLLYHDTTNLGQSCCSAAQGNIGGIITLTIPPLKTQPK